MMKLSQVALLFVLFSIGLGCSGIDHDGGRAYPASAPDGDQVLLDDAMTGDWRDNWFLDGKKATLRNSSEGLYFAGGTITKADDPVEYHAHHAVLWTKEEFAGDIRISYEVTRNRNDTGTGATLLYIQARGIGTPPYHEDISAWNELREIPAMSQYYNYMDLLSISFRENLRLRRYPWNDANGEPFPGNGIVEPMVDYEMLAAGDTHYVEVDKREQSLRLRLFDGKSRELLIDQTWDTTQVAEGRDPAIIQIGRIGLRHMGTRQLTYKNFKVEQLPAIVGEAAPAR